MNDTSDLIQIDEPATPKTWKFQIARSYTQALAADYFATAPHVMVRSGQHLSAEGWKYVHRHMALECVRLLPRKGNWQRALEAATDQGGALVPLKCKLRDGRTFELIAYITDPAVPDRHISQLLEVFE